MLFYLIVGPHFLIPIPIINANTDDININDDNAYPHDCVFPLDIQFVPAAINPVAIIAITNIANIPIIILFIYINL